MATHAVVFAPYHRGRPPVVTVWRPEGFRTEVGDLFRACSPAEKVHFSNINALIHRFASGEKLSSDAFRQERDGYAFRSGPIRFYGAFSNSHRGAFVLSHAIVKRHQKLHDADVARMVACRDAFDSLAALPAVHT